mgnify:CR=1 FL=1
MKKKQKMWLKIGVGIVVVLAVLVMARNQMIKTGARAAVQKATGFDLEVGRVHAGLVSPTFEIRDLKLINPEDFPEATAFEVKQAKVNCDLASLLKDEIHLREVVLDVPKAVVVKKEDGETNLKRLSDAGKREERTGETGSAGEGEGKGEGKAEKPAKRIRIDLLTVRLGTVEMRDYSRGGDKPVISTYELNVDRSLQNVTSLADVGVMISAEIVANIGAKVVGDIGKELEKHQGDIDKAAKSIGDTLGSIFGGKRKPAPAK